MWQISVYCNFLQVLDTRGIDYWVNGTLPGFGLWLNKPILLAGKLVRGVSRYRLERGTA